MPICPRCGKCLTSDQALTYHMNRKYKCGSWKCSKCEQVCNTKLDLQMHHIHCLPVQTVVPSYEMLLQVFENIPGILVVSKDKVVVHASPNTKEHFGLQHLEGCALSNLTLSQGLHIKPIHDRLLLMSKL